MPVILFRPHCAHWKEGYSRIPELLQVYAVFLFQMEVGPVMLGVVSYICQYVFADMVVYIGAVHNGDYIVGKA